MHIPLPIKKILRPLYVPLFSWHYDTFKAPKRYHHLYDTIRSLRAKSILEIGVWNGKRAVEIITVAKEGSSDISYYGYDLFEDLGETGYHSELSKRPPTEANVRALLLETGARVTLFRGNTLTTLPETVGEVGTVDFVFIDGGHSVETIANDWKYVEKCMHEKTVVIFDDYWRNKTDAGCKPVIDAIDRNLFVVDILPEIDTFNNADHGRLEISFARVTRK